MRKLPYCINVVNSDALETCHNSVCPEIYC